eukprot:bmy_19608T0
MAPLQKKHTLSSEFIILGFGDLAELQIFLSGLFLIMHLVTLARHTTLALVTLFDSMYFFLRKLSTIEIGYILVIVPSMLANFLSGSQRMPFLGRALQMHLFSALGRAVFPPGCNGYDHFVAICMPLHYTLVIARTLWLQMLALAIHLAAGRSKAFSICAGHLLVSLLHYGCAVFIYIHPKSCYAPEQDKIVSLIYTNVTPMLYPMIYSLRNKEVKGALKRLLESHDQTRPAVQCKGRGKRGSTCKSPVGHLSAALTTPSLLLRAVLWFCGRLDLTTPFPAVTGGTNPNAF